jgi:hypothetical protein
MQKRRVKKFICKTNGAYSSFCPLIGILEQETVQKPRSRCQRTCWNYIENREFRLGSFKYIKEQVCTTETVSHQRRVLHNVV